MDLGLANRAFVVTGGSSGLGFATASVLVSEGAQVLLVARREAVAHAAASRLGPRAHALVGDLADADTADRALDAALDIYGRVDGSLISVGGPPPGSVLTTSDEQWLDAFSSVFLGAVRVARRTCMAIRDSGASSGALALVLSTSAVEVFPGLSTSNGLRPGLGMLVKDLADEVGPDGLRVNGLLPGRIATDRLAALDEATGDPAAARERATDRIPLRRYGDPVEFGRVAAFVLSPAASYVTGTLISVDGGSTRIP